MHIPNHMIDSPINEIAAGAAVVGVSLALYYASKSKQAPTFFNFSALTAFIFLLQMFNFPVQDGTSGHFLGGAIAAALLGTPFGILSISLVVTIQTLLFSDGGLLSLGANILNMGLIGAGLSGFIYQKFASNMKNKIQTLVLLGLISWGSVVMVSIFCSIELFLSGVIPFTKVFPAMTQIHALIGIGEAFISLMLFSFVFVKVNFNIDQKKQKLIFGLLGAMALFLGLIASSYPDGLEWVSQQNNFFHAGVGSILAPFSGYKIELIQNEWIAKILSGMLGTGSIFFVALLFCIRKTKRKRAF